MMIQYKTADHYKRMISINRLSHKNVNHGMDTSKKFLLRVFFNYLTNRPNDFNLKERALIIGYKEYIKEVIKKLVILYSQLIAPYKKADAVYAAAKCQ
jgi:hypothetical protein